MTSREIEQCRQKLIRLQSELQALEGPSANGTEALEQDQSDTANLSRKDVMEAQKAAEEGPRLRKRQIQKIEGALRRIDLGEFGRCFVCEEELEAGRLAEDPTITRCPNCEET